MREITVLIFDGNLHVHKAFHVHPNLSAKMGNATVATGIPYGVVRTIVRCNQLYGPCLNMVAFDYGINLSSKPLSIGYHNHRQRMYGDYKKDRKHPRPEIKDGMRLLVRFLDNMAVTVSYASMEFEADDIIAYTARRCADVAKEKGVFIKVIIVSDDKDFNQLVYRGKTHEIVLHKRGDKIVDYESFIQEHGFRPNRFVDYLALQGDKVDNIPGINGYGPVKAKKMVKENSTLAITKTLDRDFGATVGWNFERNVKLIDLSSTSESCYDTVTHHKCQMDSFNSLAKALGMQSFLRDDDQRAIQSMRPFML